MNAQVKRPPPPHPGARKPRGDTHRIDGLAAFREHKVVAIRVPRLQRQHAPRFCGGRVRAEVDGVAMHGLLGVVGVELDAGAVGSGEEDTVAEPGSGGVILRSVFF